MTAKKNLVDEQITRTEIYEIYIDLFGYPPEAIEKVEDETFALCEVGDDSDWESYNVPGVGVRAVKFTSSNKAKVDKAEKIARKILMKEKFTEIDMFRHKEVDEKFQNTGVPGI